MKAGLTLSSTLLILAMSGGIASAGMRLDAATLRMDPNLPGEQAPSRVTAPLESKLAWHAVYARSAAFDAGAIGNTVPVLDDSGRPLQATGSAQADRAANASRGLRAGVIGHVPSNSDAPGSMPEPGRWAMLFAGLFGVVAIARRRSALQ
jgi:hypothetical protein